MLIVLLLTFTILISIITHSTVIVLFWFLFVVLLSFFNIWKLRKQNILISILVILLWYWSVLYYDMRVWWNNWSHQTNNHNLIDNFVIVSKPRLWRYIIESYPQWTSRSNRTILYSTQSLIPWDVISITKPILPREYNPIMCVWICDTSHFSSSYLFSRLITTASPNGFLDWNRQSGHVVDNDYVLSQNTFANLFENKDFNYDGRLYMQNIDATVYDNNVTIHEHTDLWFFVQVRNMIFHTITEKFGTTIQAWLILGMTIWDRSLISQERYDQFVDSGLVHLIAVSGGNIAIVTIFFSFALFWLPFYMRQAVLLCVVVGYALIVWWDTSVIRATIMWLLTILALFPGRQISIWRTLSYARCLMLLYNPYYILYDMWFLLSFWAIIGIVWWEKTYRSFMDRQSYAHDKNKIISLWVRINSMLQLFIKLYIVPTIGAVVWVLPLLLWSMWQINIITPLINILIVPFVPLITIIWFIVSFVPLWIFSWYIESLLSTVMNYILWLSIIGTRYSVVVQMDFWIGIVLLVCVICYWIYWIGKQKE